MNLSSMFRNLFQSTTRKLSNALGEVLLIVFGILIAFQIESWNEDRKEKAFRHSALLEIHAALKRDLQHIEARIRRVESIEQAMTLLSGSLASKPEFSDELADAFVHLAHSVVFEPRSGPYETLKANGLNVLDDVPLQLALINHYDYLYPRMEWMLEHELNYFNRTVSTPLLYEYFKLDKSANPPHELTPIDFDTLTESSSVMTTIRRKADKANSIKSRFERVRRSAESVLNLVGTSLAL